MVDRNAFKWPKNDPCRETRSLIDRQIRDIPFKEDRIMDDVTLNDIMSVIKSLVNDEKVSDNAFRSACSALLQRYKRP